MRGLAASEVVWYSCCDSCYTNIQSIIEPLLCSKVPAYSSAYNRYIIINHTFLVQKNKLLLTCDFIIRIPCLFIHDIFSIGIKFLRQGIPFLKIMWQINPEFMMLWVLCLGHSLWAWTIYSFVLMFGRKFQNETNNWFFHTQFTFWVAPEKSPA